MSRIAHYSIGISGIDTFITRIEVIMIQEFNLTSSDINSAPNNTHACVFVAEKLCCNSVF